MGRNKNKNNRSANRQYKPTALSANAGRKKDAGLPAFFKQRREALQKDQAKELQANDDVDMLAGGDAKGKETLQSLAKSSVAAASDSDNATPIAEAAFTFGKGVTELAVSGKRDSSVKAFMRDVKNVIENSDVLLQVLDARDPLGCRSRQTELMAMGSGKKVVLILNKVDLIPVSNLQAWLRYLRNDFPTLAFKSSTQQQRTHLKQGHGQIDLPNHSSNTGTSSSGSSGSGKLSFGSEAIGANALLQLLKNYARTAVKGSSVKHQLTVGVVGPPNVGKSSLINSLLRTRACAVASTPGWTKVIQHVALEKGIKLLDCPGVVVSGGFPSDSSYATNDDEEAQITKDDLAWNMLRNTIKVELIEDPIAPVQAMLKRVDAEQLVQLYSIEGGFNEGDAHDFLLRIALLRGKLAKGGVPDLEGAARIVLHDWNIGRISFYTNPPAVHPSLVGKHTDGEKAAMEKIGAEEMTEARSTPVHDSVTAGSSLKTGFSEAFDLFALLGEADAEAMGITQTAGQTQRDLIARRERVYAPESISQVSDVKSIECDDDDDIDNSDRAKPDKDVHAADLSHTSTLGKRTRNKMDEMLSSDEEDGDNDRRTGLSVLQDSDDEDDDLPLVDHDTTEISLGVKRVQEPRQSRQVRELEHAMGEYEVSTMARKRSDVRRMAKKQSKRMRKSGAGLVDAWTSGMALRGGGDDDAEKRADKEQRQEQNDAKVRTNTRRGLFDVLSNDNSAAANEDSINVRGPEEEEEL